METLQAAERAEQTAQPVSDAQAEAMIRAIGPPLEWEHKEVAGIHFWGADHGTELYLISTGSDSLLGACRRDKGKRDNYSKERYKSLSEAKAACEHHHATGKWNG